MKLTDHYPLPWNITFMPEEHRPAVRYAPPKVSGTGNIIEGQAAYDREANTEISRIVAANGEEIPIGCEEGGLCLGDEMIVELVRMLNSTKGKT